MRVVWLLLCSAWNTAVATPPPIPVQPPRILGLNRTFVTPSTFVDGLSPSVAGAGLAPRAVVHVTAIDLVDPVARALEAVAGVRAVTVLPPDADGDAHAVIVDFDGEWRDLSAVKLPDGRTIPSVAPITGFPRLVVPLPSGGAPAIPPFPVRLPGSSESALRGPPTPTEPPPNEPGWDLELFNRHVGGVSVVSVEGIAIGEALPYTLVVLRDVKPGLYEVTFQTPSGVVRTTRVRSVRRDAPFAAPPEAGAP